MDTSSENLISSTSVSKENSGSVGSKWPAEGKKPETWVSGPQNITWRINGETILLLGWGRAVLLQIAHPLVAEGVSQHSYFSKSTRARLKRTERTLNKMLEMTFGDANQAWDAARFIDAIHGRVNGKLSETIGSYAPAGTEYSARMYDLLKWVQCTFVDSMLKVYELYVEPLSLAEKDQYVRETSVSGPMLGTPENYFPTTYAELQSYLNSMLESGKIVVGSHARELAEYVLAPIIPLPILDKLVNWYLLLPVAGLLPTFVREGYDLKWTKFDQRAFKFQIWTYRHLVRPVLPRRLRLFPVAIKAEKRVLKQAS